MRRRTHLRSQKSPGRTWIAIISQSGTHAEDTRTDRTDFGAANVTNRLIVATPYEVLKFIGRGTSLRDYQRLKAAFDRLQSTTVATSIRQHAEGRRHRFSWINEWKERRDGNGRPDGIELILPDWFYQAVLDDALVLTIDRAYFGLTGGLDRWLYRLVRKHGGKQRNGWRFDLRHLHQKSGSLSPFKRFAFELRDIVRRQPLPGYVLLLEVERGGRTLLAFKPSAPCGKPVDGVVPSGTEGHVPSGTRGSCQREPERGLNPYSESRIAASNLDSNQESNFEARARDVRTLIDSVRGHLSVNVRPRRSPTRNDQDVARAPKLPFDVPPEKPPC